MSKATNDALNALHASVAKTLKDKIEDGSASASDISNAIKFLKDNGIEADIGTSPALNSLATSFPDYPTEEEMQAPN